MPTGVKYVTEKHFSLVKGAVTHLTLIAFSFVLFLRDRFSKFYCFFRQRFSAAYLLKVSLLPKRVHTTLFIRCDKPELAC